MLAIALQQQVAQNHEGKADAFTSLEILKLDGCALASGVLQELGRSGSACVVALALARTRTDSHYSLLISRWLRRYFYTHTHTRISRSIRISP